MSLGTPDGVRTVYIPMSTLQAAAQSSNSGDDLAAAAHAYIAEHGWEHLPQGIFSIFLIAPAESEWFLDPGCVSFAVCCERFMTIHHVLNRPSQDTVPAHQFLTCGPAWWSVAVEPKVRVVTV